MEHNRCIRADGQSGATVTDGPDEVVGLAVRDILDQLDR